MRCWYFILKIYLFYFREREQACMQARAGGAEGEEERIQSGFSVLSMEPDAGLDLMTLRSQPELKPSQMVNRLHQPGALRPTSLNHLFTILCMVKYILLEDLILLP